MISISRLYNNVPGSADALRYGTDNACMPGAPFTADPQGATAPRPVVAWNITRRCNLRCVHCYAVARTAADADELTFAEACRFLDGLAAFNVPAVLFSGGEPLLHPRVFDLLQHASQRGLTASLSTNGTRIDQPTAVRLRDAGVKYVGISLDGLAATNDRFRGVSGAFDLALRGMRASRDAGMRVGLRFTMTRENVDDIPGLLDLAADEGIPRVCIYHLAYSGRGGALIGADLSAAATRRALDTILDGARRLQRKNREVELLTVGNHADGAYLLDRLETENPDAAAKALMLLRHNGGNASGERIACVAWNGIVYPDQFWRNRPVGDVRLKPFGEIWSAPDNTLLQQLRERKKHLKGRCAACRRLDICNGNLRARAEAISGDMWAPDPACYLSDKETAKAG